VSLQAGFMGHVAELLQGLVLLGKLGLHLVGNLRERKHTSPVMSSTPDPGF